jgi:hypothetical protein
VDPDLNPNLACAEIIGVCKSGFGAGYESGSRTKKYEAIKILVQILKN